MHAPSYARQVNKAIEAKFPGYSVMAEPGYVRIMGPDTHEWYSSSVPTCYIRDMTPEEWVSEVENAINNVRHGKKMGTSHSY